MTTCRKPLARYGAVKGALASGLLPLSYTTPKDMTSTGFKLHLLWLGRRTDAAFAKQETLEYLEGPTA